ncbi:MAG: peptide ABC transporter substrate-binding protein, partial [Clostridiales bacterium]|nr:peptide ABC transporter substrate-binding protein [Clostridiales bacterium]
TENFIRYENEDMDKILDNINAFQTQSEKKKHYAELQKLIIDDLPYVSLFFTNGAILSNKKLYGDLKPSFENVYNDIDEWFIPKKYQSEEQ